MEQYKERVTEAINEEKEQNLIKVSDLKDVPAVVHFNNYFKYYIKVTPRIQQFFNSVPLESSILVIYKKNKKAIEQIEHAKLTKVICEFGKSDIYNS